MFAFIRRHPVASYFVLTFAISWGGVLVAMGPAGIPRTPERFEQVRTIAIAAMLAGPSLAGLLMIALVRGKAGFRELLARLLTWRVPVRWYAAALLIAPLVTMAMLMTLSLASPAFLPGIVTTDDKMSRLMFGLTAAVAVGITEELGWTGFATPELRRRYSILATGLIIGVLWGAWHISGPVVLASGTYTGDLPLSVFLITRTIVMLIGGLPAYRVLTVWVYDRTGSLLVAMLMHMSLTACALILEPVGISGMSLLVSDAVSILTWWVVVFAMAMAGGWIRSRPSRPSTSGNRQSTIGKQSAIG
jgi:membrane protease YdiL (CAAX protease family)